ncbi:MULTISPECIES: trigger factor family protein [unclassified Candidatus Cardinium]|uniref:trigger factor family protein n=1 Tax=unclassified Candidatus Cardinium TaxID=2641185 RepID=UPI001FB1E025|nr:MULTISPECIES: trigger factor family protein [unclassified Candidatus Cardinium]
MDIQFNKINPNHGVISIVLHEPDYKSAVEKKLKHYAQTVRLKGFRLGAAPVDLIRKMYGPSILAQELNTIAVAALKDYIVQERIPIFIEPLFITPSQEIDFTTQDTFTFSYEVGLMEERSIALGPDICVTEFEVDHVDPKLVDEFLQALQIVHGQAVPLEETTKEAILYGSLTDSKGEVGLDIRISVMHVPDHLSPPLIGRRVGDKVTVREEMLQSHFTALLGISFAELITFKRYKSAWPAIFTITKIIHVVPAPIESRLFDLVLGERVATTESAFREAIAKIILFDKRTEARHAFYEDLRKELFKHNPVHLPESFLKKWLAFNNPQSTLKQIEDYYDAHEETLKWEILLGSIVRQNDLAVSSSDIVDETKRAYLDYAHNSGLALEANDDMIHAGALAFLKGKEGNQYYTKMHNHLSNDRAINFIKERISVVHKTVTAQAFDLTR